MHPEQPKPAPISRTCVECRNGFVISVEQQATLANRGHSLPKRCRKCRHARRQMEAAVANPKPRAAGNADFEPDWTRHCDNCHATPIVLLSGMCGPCTFGESETGGNW